ncbi:MAG: restriction endonuclease [Leptospiraceae bacterium]|jgi:tetratricopeptide (TPR) repeat protein|nr:restriction endonuclease [Leptospiraceae bacterium]
MNTIIIFILFFLFIIIIISIYFFSKRKDPIEKALELADEGNFLDARALIRRFLEKDPQNPKYHYAMALIYQKEGDEENYINHLKEMYKLKKSVPELPFYELINKIANYNYKNEYYYECIRLYEEALKHNKNNVEALARLAFIYAGQEYFEKADEYFNRLLSLVPNKIEFYLAKGIINSALNKKEAIEIFKKVVEMQPDHTLGLLFLGIESYRKKIFDDDLILKLEEHLKNITTLEIRYLFHKLLMGLYYHKKNYNKALYHAENALQIVLKENLLKDEYYIRIAYACLGILGGDIENAHENLFILESRDFHDQTVTTLSDYRMAVEEGIIAPGQASPSGFDFMNFINNWMDKLFTSDFIYKISGLKMNTKIDIPLLGKNPSEVIRKGVQSPSIDIDTLIDNFNALSRSQFLELCSRIVQMYGYQVVKQLPPDDNEGFDCIAENFEGKKAYFKIRQWKSQSISDIFLRNFQNKINETKVQEGYIISGARLTPGGEQALQNLKKIKVINGEDFAKLLANILTTV